MSVNGDRLKFIGQRMLVVAAVPLIIATCGGVTALVVGSIAVRFVIAPPPDGFDAGFGEGFELLPFLAVSLVAGVLAGLEIASRLVARFWKKWPASSS